MTLPIPSLLARSRRPSLLALLAALALGAGCGPDAGSPDGGPIDAGPRDARVLDDDSVPFDAPTPIDATDAFVPEDAPLELDAPPDAPPDAAPPPCGDGDLDPGEVCDDSNTVGGDGCRADCLGEEECGDGLADVGEWCPSRTATSTRALGGSIVGPPLLADADEDGDLDVYVVVDSELVLLENDGSGAFAAPIATGAANAGRFVDLDGDPGPELIGLTGSALEVRTNDGTGVFGAVASYPVSGVVALAAGDVDGDLDADVVTIAFGSGECTVRTNDGSGALTAGTPFTCGVEALAALIADVDRDGAADIVVLQDLGTDNVAVVPGLAGGGFGAPRRGTTGFPTAGASLADVDLDGDLDLAHGVQILPNRIDVVPVVAGAPTAPISVTIPGFGAPQLIDADLDGDPDLYAAGSTGTGPFSILFEGDGTGAFPTRLDEMLPPRATLADLDGDLAIDAIAVVAGELRVHLATP